MSMISSSSSSSSAIRHDREQLEFRKMKTELNLINEMTCTGSARYCQGNTEVIACIYGPSQPKYLRHESHEGIMIDVTYSSSLGGGIGGGNTDPDTAFEDNSGNGGSTVVDPSSDITCQDRKISKLIKQIVLDMILNKQQYSRLLLSINVIIIEDDGCCVSVALNAIILALLRCGINLRYVPSACTVAIVSIKSLENGTRNVDENDEDDEEGLEVLLDPTVEELQYATSLHTYVFRSSDSQHTETNTDENTETGTLLGGNSIGTYTPQQHSEILQLCRQGCEQVGRFIRESVKVV